MRIFSRFSPAFSRAASTLSANPFPYHFTSSSNFLSLGITANMSSNMGNRQPAYFLSNLSGCARRADFISSAVRSRGSLSIPQRFLSSCRSCTQTMEPSLVCQKSVSIIRLPISYASFMASAIFCGAKSVSPLCEWTRIFPPATAENAAAQTAIANIVFFIFLLF